MSKPGKSLRNLCKKLGVRLTVKRGKKRVYKSIAVLKRQCANKKKAKKKKVVKRKRNFGTKKIPSLKKLSLGALVPYIDFNDPKWTEHPLGKEILKESMFKMIAKYNKIRDLIQEKMAIPGDYIKNLEGADLGMANLKRADLRGANLEGANLEGANLERADLRGANLRGARLVDSPSRRANLRGANLEGANLVRANLEGANLVRANLEGACLDGANLDSANLLGANLRGALLIRANYDEGTHLPKGVNPYQRGMVVQRRKT